jgi:NTE family protein
MHVKLINNQLISIALLLSLLSGCATTARVTNVAIDEDIEVEPYTQLEYLGENEDLKIFLSFSGGGTRAAAFSYGVLETLRDTTITLNNETTSLLDQVDVISSVSGGSFTSAYYGLYGNKIFEDYERVFLKKNVQQGLVSGILNPLNWFRFIGSGFNRTELAVEYYDEYIFKEATFADFRKDMPFIQINATDLSSGEPFIFKQEYFDLICSDLSQFKVSRAVAASSAVPVAFAPITVKNYKECADTHLSNYLTRFDDNDNFGANKMKEALQRYRDKDSVQYVHLIDGGISDNLGIRVFYDSLNFIGGVSNLPQKLISNPPKYMVVILINAAVLPEKEMDTSADEPALSDQIEAISSAQINRYSIESIQLVKESLEMWTADLSELTGQEVKPFFIQVDFYGVQDHEKKNRVNMISTSFSLPDEEVDGLRDAARFLLNESPEFQRLLKELNGKSDEHIDGAVIQHKVTTSH